MHTEMELPQVQCNTILAVLMIAFVLCVCGCKGSRSSEPCPTSGKVMVNGKGIAGVYVVFHSLDDPERKASPDSAITTKDGSFSLNVRAPGEYSVTAFWPAVTVEDNETVEGEDRFKGKYRKPEQPILKVTVHNGENTIPVIRLKSS